MSKRTSEINKVTGTIISVSLKLIIFILIIFFLYMGVTKGYEFGYSMFNPSAVDQYPGIDKTVRITGSSVKDAAEALEGSGLIDNKYIFEIQAKFYEYEIYPGEYNLNTSQNSKEILQILSEKPEQEGDE